MARIAVVDDSKLVRVFVAAAMRTAGHEVFQVEPDSLQTTVDALIDGKPELMVLDHSMPAFQGSSLVRACYENPALSRIKVVILTAFHDEAMAERMRKLGVDCVLHKPIQPEELIQAVERILRREPEGPNA